MDSFFFIYTAEDGQTEHTLHVAVADSPDASHVSNLTIAFDSEPILLHEPRFAGSGDATWRASDGSCALEHLMTSAATDGVRVNISGVVDMGIQVNAFDIFHYRFFLLRRTSLRTEFLCANTFALDSRGSHPSRSISSRRLSG